jgi:hypothetical protein
MLSAHMSVAYKNRMESFLRQLDEFYFTTAEKKKFIAGVLPKAQRSRHEAMVGGALARASALSVGLGVGGATIVSGSCVHPSHSWISRLLTSSLSLGISSLFCRVTQCM